MPTGEVVGYPSNTIEEEAGNAIVDALRIENWRPMFSEDLPGGVEIMDSFTS